MLRLARIIAVAAASGVFLAVPPLAAHAAVLTSSCAAVGTAAGYPVTCTLYESKSGAPSEVSDIATIPTTNPVPTWNTVLVENPAASQTDPKNWSDVVEFIPQVAGSPQSFSVEILSVGCGNLQDPTDITCFPAAASVNQFVQETLTGSGNDFTDCTTYAVPFPPPPAPSQDAVDVTACSDSPAVETGDTVPIPEVPMPILLPIAALGLVAVAGLRRSRRRSA